MLIFNTNIQSHWPSMADDEFAGESVGDGDERGNRVGNERREKALRLGNSWGPGGPGRKLGELRIGSHCNGKSSKIAKLR